MAFESVVVIGSLCDCSTVQGLKEMTECRNYRAISMLSMVGKIYARILVERVCIVTEVLIDDELGGFRSGRCVD